jgi:hypothetical protein
MQSQWARARALRDAYEKLREEKAPAGDYPYLSTGDVFSWLADTGLSLRQGVPQSAPNNASCEKGMSERIIPSTVNTFCATCGLESSRHPSAQSSSWEGPSGGSCCRSSPMPRLPLLDVGAIALPRLANGPVQSTRAEKGPFRWPIQDVLAATDPSLTFAVRCIIAPLKLSCFPESQRTSISGAGVLRPNGTAIMVDGPDINRCDLATISESLASVAVLALAVREFTRRLVESAVTAFANDRRGRGSPRILVPAHVSLGVAVADSFLTRDGVLAPPPPPTSPVALALSTLVRHASRDPSPPSAVMGTPCSDPASPAASQYAR